MVLAGRPMARTTEGRQWWVQRCAEKTQPAHCPCRPPWRARACSGFCTTVLSKTSLPAVAGHSHAACQAGECSRLPSWVSRGNERGSSVCTVRAGRGGKHLCGTRSLGKVFGQGIAVRYAYAYVFYCISFITVFKLHSLRVVLARPALHRSMDCRRIRREGLHVRNSRSRAGVSFSRRVRAW